MKYASIAARVFDQPLLIDDLKLETILQVLGPRLNLDMPALPESELADRRFRTSGIEIAYDDEDKNDRTAPYWRTPDGTALIQVDGTLVHRVTGVHADSGLQSYGSIVDAFMHALDNPKINRIAFELDSYGGEAASELYDLAERIYTNRAVKPSVAIVNEAAFSAAYLIASACGEVVVPRSGGVGSVGVIAVHYEQSRYDEKVGLTVTHVFAGNRKADFSTHLPLADEALEWLQENVDKEYGYFTAAVAKYRGMSEQAVRDTQAQVYVGEDAVEIGFADAVVPVPDAINRNYSTTRRIQTMSKQTVKPSAQAEDKPTTTTEGPAAVEEAPKTEAAAPEAEPVTQEQLTAAVEQARTEATAEARDKFMADAVEIVSACATLGRPDLAGQLIAEGRDPKAAKARAVELQAAAEEDLNPRHTGTGTDKPSQPRFDRNKIRERMRGRAVATH